MKPCAHNREKIARWAYGRRQVNDGVYQAISSEGAKEGCDRCRQLPQGDCRPTSSGLLEKEGIRVKPGKFCGQRSLAIRCGPSGRVVRNHADQALEHLERIQNYTPIQERFLPWSQAPQRKASAQKSATCRDGKENWDEIAQNTTIPRKVEAPRDWERLSLKPGEAWSAIAVKVTANGIIAQHGSPWQAGQENLPGGITL